MVYSCTHKLYYWAGINTGTALERVKLSYAMAMDTTDTVEGMEEDNDTSDNNNAPVARKHQVYSMQTTQDWNYV